MPSTYEPIATATATGTTVTFSSIPQTYTDIVYTIFTPTTGGVNTNMNFNGDTAGNYSFLQAYGEAGFSTPTSFRIPNSTYCLSGVSDGTAAIRGHIMNYSNTSTFKTMFCRGGGSGRYLDMTVSQWRNTAAITSILVGPNLSTGSIITLYGIKAA
jgi:hypothetical protein